MNRTQGGSPVVRYNPAVPRRGGGVIATTADRTTGLQLRQLAQPAGWPYHFLSAVLIQIKKPPCIYIALDSPDYYKINLLLMVI